MTASNLKFSKHFSHTRNLYMQTQYNARFQVLTAASMKMTAFWDIAPCSVVVQRRFKDAYCLHQGDDGSSTPKYLYKLTNSYIPS